MIYTITFKPSLDYYVKVNNLKSGTVNRAISERLEVGGKGINVSLALKELDELTTAFAFVGGFTGKVIREKLAQSGLTCNFIEVDGQSRINVKIKSTNETDVNGTGAQVLAQHIDKLTAKLKRVLKPGDWVVVSGSVPTNLGENTYSDFLNSIKGKRGVKVVVDACGNLLLNTLKFKPFLIKPNVYELCEIFNLSTTPDKKQIIACARKLQEMGARNVIVSMGSQGAVMVTETEQSLFIRAMKGQVVNSVGAGDSMIAGFIHEYIASNNYFAALNFATAAGTACAFTAGIATRSQIEYVASFMN